MCTGGTSDNILFDIPIGRVLSNLVALPRHARLELGAKLNGAIHEEVVLYAGNLTEIDRGG